MGAWVPIDLPEMGVQGEALVTAVQPCPEIEEGEGRLVTGTFRRSKALVIELKVAGESDVLGVTGNHSVWSEDRQDWVTVKDLDIGERLRAWDGSTPVVEALMACSAPEPVFNLEVEGDHCYRVGEQGLLVHNASAPCDPCAQRWPSGRRGLKYIDFDTITITYKETMRDPNNPNKRITIGMQKSVQFKKVKQIIARLKYYGPDPTREPINTTRDWFRGDSSIGYESDTPGHILANRENWCQFIFSLEEKTGRENWCQFIFSLAPSPLRALQYRHGKTTATGR